MENSAFEIKRAASKINPCKNDRKSYLQKVVLTRYSFISMCNRVERNKTNFECRQMSVERRRNCEILYYHREYNMLNIQEDI